MSEAAHLLMIEFLDWISRRPRTYAETMNAWQSTCPRHTIWEDAMIDGFIELDRKPTLVDPEVILTPLGKAMLNGSNGRH